MSSSTPETPEAVKKPARPKFNRVQFKKKSADTRKTPTTLGNTLSFFHRSADTYSVTQPSDRNAGKKGGKDGGDKTSPKRMRGETEDSEDEDNRETRRRRAGEILRKKYQSINIDASDSNAKKPSSMNDHKDREPSLTPPPRLYSEEQLRRHRPTSPLSRQPTRSASRQLPAVISIDSDDEAPATRRPVPPTTPPRTSGTPEDDVITTSANALSREDTFALIKARQQARQRAATSTEPVISILIMSPLPDTKPLIVKRRLDQNLKDVRLYWCKEQGYSDAETNEVFLVWKKQNKLLDYVSCKGIGVTASQVEGADYNVMFEAMNEEIFKSRLAEHDFTEEKVEEEGEPEEVLRLTLKSKGKDECKLRVGPSDTISRLSDAYRKKFNLDPSVKVRLDFEGDTLEPEDQIKDTELEDMCLIDVYVQ